MGGSANGCFSCDHSTSSVQTTISRTQHNLVINKKREGVLVRVMSESGTRLGMGKMFFASWGVRRIHFIIEIWLDTLGLFFGCCKKATGKIDYVVGVGWYAG